MYKKLSNEDIKLLESLIEKYGAEFVVNELRIPKKFFPALVSAGLSIGGATGVNALYNRTHQDSKEDEISKKDDTVKNPYNMSDEDYELFLEKVDAVGKEIDRILGYRGQSKDDIDFSIENLVYQCYKYNFDLPLAMAQAHWESHYGTTSRAQRTKSMFSVGSYDNGHNASIYDTMDDCIEPYIKIMLRDFMQNGTRSADDILNPGEFYRLFGRKKARYASDPEYEGKIRRQRNNIIKSYPVLAKPYSSYNI